MFIDDKLKFYVLHFSVWGDLWPYSNAYVRPGTRANLDMHMHVLFDKQFDMLYRSRSTWEFST